MKRIVTVQDISCVGKCSLTVALPIISAMGVETAILPTAVLSTHTMFEGYTFHDLTDEILPIAAHWKKEMLDFDALYTGYLGSLDQVEIVARLFDDFKTEKNRIIVDPVMADNGKMYPLFDLKFAKAMAKLCAKADIIVPNLTEACFLTDTPYCEEPDEAYICSLLKKLAELKPREAVVITGVSFEKGKTGVIGMNVKTKQIFSYTHHRIPRSYHGTGDIFSSTFVGALTRGVTMLKALQIAADYTASCIQETMDHDPTKIYGVNFELMLPDLISRLDRELQNAA